MTNGPRDADDLRDRIASTIRSRGPLPFDRFMELALYGEGGYYERPPVGLGGDFVTSPHVHPWFAYALARVFGSLHEALGEPVPGRLVEVGAGDGTLARQIREILAGGGPLEYVAVERSEGARATLGGVVTEVHGSIDEIDRIDHALVVANELLDNLPFRRLRRTPRGPVEVAVGLQGDRLVEVELEVPVAPEGTPSDPAPPSEAVVPTGAVAFIDALAARMADSYALLIDYSAERGREVHGYRGHGVVADVLERPGSADVTAGVDFDAVEARARDAGLAVLGRVTQRDAMLALGFGEWGDRDRSVRSNEPPGDRTRAWASRSRASLLIAPDGLGAHRWLLLATPGLPAPDWLGEALDRGKDDRRAGGS